MLLGWAAARLLLEVATVAGGVPLAPVSLPVPVVPDGTSVVVVVEDVVVEETVRPQQEVVLLLVPVLLLLGVIGTVAESTAMPGGAAVGSGAGVVGRGGKGSATVEEAAVTSAVGGTTAPEVAVPDPVVEKVVRTEATEAQ